MTDDSLPDDDHVAHYCGPRDVDDDGLPSALTFLPRESDQYLSVNWLEYFKAPSRASAIEYVRDALGAKITLKRSGGLWVLNVGATKAAARRAGNETLCVEHQPEETDPSHAGMGGYTSSDRVVALLLQSLVQHEDMYPATNEG